MQNYAECGMRNEIADCRLQIADCRLQIGNTRFFNPHSAFRIPHSAFRWSLGFYRALWGIEPVKVRRGYAKFDIAEPAVNLTLNEMPVKESGGINHLGIQVGSTETVMDMRRRLEERGLKIAIEEIETNCCYAIQDKIWVSDPNGYRWEVFVVLEDNLSEVSEFRATGCCIPGKLAMVELGGLKQ